MNGRRWIVPIVATAAAIAFPAVVSLVDQPIPARDARPPVAAPTPGVDASTIRVGVFHLGIDAYSEFAGSVMAGHTLYWDLVNESGGIAGRTVIVEAPGGLSTAAAMSAAFSVSSPDVALVSSTVGTSLIASAAGEDAVVVVADSPVSAWTDTGTVILDAGHATYAAEVAAGVTWAFSAEGLGIDRALPIGLLYQEDAYGVDCRHGLEWAVESLSLAPPLEIAYPAGAPDLSEQVVELAAGAPHLVVVCATPWHLGELVSIAGIDTTYLATSASYSPELIDIVGAEALTDVRVMSSIPPLDSVDLQRFLDAIPPAAAASVDDGFLVGWAQAATAHAVLDEAAARGDLSRGGVVATLQHGMIASAGWGVTRIGLSDDDRIPLLPLYVMRPSSGEWGRRALAPVAGPLGNPVIP